jgi:hypothetical protein
MTFIKSGINVLLALLLLGACKAKDAYDPHNPANHFNQPPLGKDTVRTIAKSVNLDRRGYFSMHLIDEADGKSYDLTMPTTSSDFGRCYLLDYHFIGPQTVIEKDTFHKSMYYVDIKHPNPMNLLEVEMSNYNIKLTIGVKKVYVRITDSTLFYYETYNQYEQEKLVRTDTASRRQAIETFEEHLLNSTGAYQLPYRKVKPYFQRK